MKPLHLLPLALLLAACGVPRESLDLAHTQAGLATDNLSDAQVAAALRAQADHWQGMAQLVDRRQLGGILLVDRRFIDLVHETAAEATRLRALMDADHDDPALRRELLAAFQKLWTQAEQYLSDGGTP